MTASAYSIAVGLAGAPDQEVTDFTAVSVNDNLDSGCEVVFDTRGSSAAAAFVDELVTDVWLYDADGLWKRLRVVQVDQAWDADGADVINVRAVDYRRLFNSRIVGPTPPSYVNQPQDEIVWGLIQHAQAQDGGDYGITYPQPGGPSLILRDRTEYAPGDNVGQRLTELTQVEDGPWFTIDGNLELVVSAWDGFATLGTPLQRGATARTLARQSGAATFANAVFVDGDDAATVPETRQTVDITTDPRGRWEATASYTSTTRQTTLAEHADAFLTQSLTPPATWTAEVEPSRFATDFPVSVGDFVTIVVPPSTAAPIGAPGGSTTVDAQVMSVGVEIGGDGNLLVTMTAVET